MSALAPLAAKELVSLPSFEAVKSFPIIEIDSFEAIELSSGLDTLYFFDIDDTLIDSPTMLGSKEWRAYIKAKTGKKAGNWHDILTLYLARNYPVVTVEKETAEFVRCLQNRGNAVFGLTARERQKWYDTPVQGIDALTALQLSLVGIHFTDHPSFSYLYDDPEYYQGVFFVDLDLKGDYVTKLFKNQKQLPERVVFVDDKKKHVESVAEALTDLNIPHACYWYVATDKRSRVFDPKIANIQLYHFLLEGDGRVLSDEEAFLIGLKNVEKTADDYLTLSLEIAKKRL